MEHLTLAVFAGHLQAADEEEGAHAIWRVGHVSVGEEALEVVENFCRSTAVCGVGGEEGA